VVVARSRYLVEGMRVGWPLRLTSEKDLWTILPIVKVGGSAAEPGLRVSF